MIKHARAAIIILWVFVVACSSPTQNGVEFTENLKEHGITSGMRLMRDPESKQWIVGNISLGTPPTLAGIQPGDVILSIEGKRLPAPPGLVAAEKSDAECQRRDKEFRDRISTFRKDLGDKQSIAVLVGRDGGTLELMVNRQPAVDLLAGGGRPGLGGREIGCARCSGNICLYDRLTGKMFCHYIFTACHESDLECFICC